MSGIQLKITHHTQKQENLNLNEKRQSKDANTEMTHMLELSDKDFKAAILTMLQPRTINTLEIKEKIEASAK